jgi:hypothetical protein
MAGEGESTLETVNTTGGDRFVRTSGPLPAQSEQEIRESMLHSELSRLRRRSGDITIPESSRQDGPNYSIWSFRMKNILQREGLWRFVTTPPLWNMSDEEKGDQICHSQHSQPVTEGQRYQTCQATGGPARHVAVSSEPL